MRVRTQLRLHERRTLRQVNLTERTAGRSALHMAAAEGNFDAIAILLEHPDLDANLRDASGVAAIDIAVAERRTDIAELLAKYVPPEVYQKAISSLVVV